jgi:phosphohistidine phosphatase
VRAKTGCTAPDRLAPVHLYLVRHATAEDRANGLDHPDRALTDDGHREAALAARALAVMGIEPDLVVTSPYRRAVETARPIASVLDAPLVEDRRLEPGFTPAEFSALWDRHGEARSLIVVGHEPDLSELISYLTGAKVRLPKSGIGRVEATTVRGRCELNWLLRPKQLRLIASARVTA